MRIAHFSDLHVLSLAGVGWHRFLGKRLTGYANLRFKRNHAHHSAHVLEVAREIAEQRIDQVVITGDITNLALESEFSLAKEILERELHLSPRDISIVPGNHDLYTRGALKSRRFTEFFSEYTRCDLDVAVDIGAGHFPYVKLRGPVAIIGLSSAVPRLPLVASGKLGRPQLEALARALEHPEVRKRTPVLLVHHPLHNPPSKLKTLVEGLTDAEALAALLSRLDKGLVLHGHLHRRISRKLMTTHGHVLAIGATSASLSHEQATRMSGFNLYEIDDATGAIGTIEAHVLGAGGKGFRIERIPEA
jgi:hypothetical protein